MASALDRIRRLPTSSIVVGLGLACLGVFLIGILGAMGVTGKNTTVAAGTAQANQASPGEQATGPSDQAGGANSGPDSGSEADISQAGAVGPAANAGALGQGLRPVGRPVLEEPLEG